MCQVVKHSHKRFISKCSNFLCAIGNQQYKYKQNYISHYNLILSELASNLILFTTALYKTWESLTFKV